MNSIRSYQQSLALMLPIACLFTAISNAQSTLNGLTTLNDATLLVDASIPEALTTAGRPHLAGDPSEYRRVQID